MRLIYISLGLVLVVIGVIIPRTMMRGTVAIETDADVARIQVVRGDNIIEPMLVRSVEYIRASTGQRRWPLPN